MPCGAALPRPAPPRLPRPAAAGSRRAGAGPVATSAGRAPCRGARNPRWRSNRPRRSPESNAKLRAAGRGVARGSLHCVGKAIDLRLPGVETAALRDAALELARGGVGYYAASDFVHLDTGRVRRW